MRAITFIWSLWLRRNDKMFDDKNSSILQVIYRCINTLRFWSSLQNMKVYVPLEATTRDTFS
jgi:hypothetical protein